MAATTAPETQAGRDRAVTAVTLINRRVTAGLRTILPTSIRGRFWLALFVFAALASGSAIAAWGIFAWTTGQVDQIVNGGVPRAQVAHRLATLAEVFASDSRRLPEIQRRHDVDLTRIDLEQRLAAISEQIAALRQLGFEPAILDEIADDLAQFEDNLTRQIALADEAIEARGRLEGAIASLGRAHEAFRNVAEPQIDEGYRQLQEDGIALIEDIDQRVQVAQSGKEPAETLSGLLDGVQQDIGALMTLEAAQMQASQQLVATVHLAVSVLGEAAGTSDAGELEALETRFAQLVEPLQPQRAMRALANPESRDLLDSSTPVLGFGTGSDGIFALRARDLAARAAGRSLADTNSHVALGIRTKVDYLVRRIREDANRIAMAVESRLSLARNLQAAGALLGALALLAIGYLYLGRNVLGRLQALNRAMELQAKGVDVPIPIRGNDEIGAMGAALSRFVEQRRDHEHRLLEQRGALEEARLHAEGANQAKSAFLAAMSHELRTPLNSILGFSQLIADGAFGPIDNDRYRDYAQDINASGRHLLDLINDVLDLSKIEAGKTQLDIEAVDVADVVTACRRLSDERAGAHGLSLSLDTDAAPPVIWADKRALKQILFNLLSNAIKFTEKGGQITIAARETAASQVCFSVSDTGCGIPAGEIDRILRPFEQMENSYARSRGGSGLGLPLVRALAKLHGGDIDIASCEGRGTTVSVILPIRPPVMDPDLVPTLAPAQPGKPEAEIGPAALLSAIKAAE